MGSDHIDKIFCTAQYIEILFITSLKMQIEKLTQDQGNKVSQYRSKWEKIALSSQFNSSDARNAVEMTYSALNLATPDIFFVASPKAAIEVVTSQNFGNPLAEVIASELVQKQLDKLTNYIHQSLLNDLDRRICFLLNAKISSIKEANEEMLCPAIKKLSREKKNLIDNCIIPSDRCWISNAALLDFCISILQCELDSVRWNNLSLLLKHCGWIYPFRRGCVVCQRPEQIIIKAGTESESAMTTLSYSDGEIQYVFKDNKGFKWRSKIVQIMYKKYES